MRPSNAWIKELLPPHEPPCVSIYMPMERAKPPAGQINPRLFRELVERACAEMERAYRRKDCRAMSERIYSLIPEEGFWVGPRDAIAVFASPDLLRLVDLQQRVESFVSVADNFHVKPLIRMLEVDQRYQVLALTLHGVRIFAGDRDGLRELDSSRIPQNPETVSKMRLNHLVDSATDLATPDTQYPGEGTAPAGVPADRFMKAVDKAVWEHFSRDARLPLILVADEKPNVLFRSVTRNDYLAAEGSMHDPKGMDAARLHRETWRLVEPRFWREAQAIVDRYMAAKARQRGSSELQPVADAAVIGRVDTLLVDAARQIPGRLEPRDDGAGAEFIPAGLKDPAADDVLDDLAEMVLKADGAVLVLPPDMMPTTSGLAAIYRY
jgi:hypothetical protein